MVSLGFGPLPSRLLGVGMVAALGLLAACSSSSSGSGSSTSSTSASASSGGDGGSGGTGGGSEGGSTARGTDPPVTVDLQNRAYDLIPPTSIDATKPAPLLILIHGFTDVGSSPWEEMDTYMKVSPETDKRGMLLARVHGNTDPVLQKYYWNATDSCCDFENANPNDVGYILAVIEDVKKSYAVDPKQIYVLGHSNGGFMANRLACDKADVFAGIVSLAGETYKDQKRCAASAPIAFLQVQGDADETVPYGGGPAEGVAVFPPAPGAIETAKDWSVKNHCDPTPDDSQPAIDLATDLAGNETTKSVYKNCEANGATEVWTIHGGPHSPDFNDSWITSVLDFLMAHPKP